jgi:WD40 repeat protein
MPIPVTPVRIFERSPDDKIGSSVAFTPSGLLLFATKNQIVEANVGTGKSGRRFTAGKSAVTCFALASASQRLAALADDGTVFLWDTATGRQLNVFKLQDGNNGSRAEYDVAISPNGKYLAVCVSGVVRVCDLTTGRIRKAFHFLSAAVFSPDGKTLYLGGARRLQAWNVFTWQPRQLRTIGDIMTHPTFTAIDCSPDGKWIAGDWEMSRFFYTGLTANNSKTLETVWETDTGSTEFMYGVSKVIYSPSGDRIAVGIRCSEGDTTGVSLSLYKAENGKSVGYYKENKTIRSIAFSRDGKFLAALTDRVTVWPAISGR